MPELASLLASLEKRYGQPKRPVTRDPFEMILFENIAYLVPDDRRERAFRELKKRVGTTPAKILSTSVEVLREIAGIGGVFPELRAQRLRQAALLVRDQFGGSLRPVLKLDFAKARRALKKFPVIGEPGAEKILLFAGAHAHLALESNGLRTLVRVGFAEEHKNYSTTYRRVQEELAGQIGEDCSWLITAHLLLKRHGQEICRRSEPLCGVCPLRTGCGYYTRSAG